MDKARTLILPFSSVGFGVLVVGVIVQNRYPATGVVTMVAGSVLISVYLLFNTIYDWVRHRQAASILSDRTQLNSDEFAARFFPESQEMAANLRDSLAEFLKLDLGGLLPDDDLNAICDAQTDDPSLVWHLEQEFQLGDTFTEYEEYLEIEKKIGTFRQLLEFVKDKSSNS